MKNSFKITMAILLFIYQSIALASPHDNAHKFVESSLAAAKEDATFLVMQDFEKILIDLTVEGQSNATSTIQNEFFLEVQKRIEDRALQLSNRDPDKIEKVSTEIENIWSEYKQIVRDRFALSFKVQDQISHSNQIFNTIQYTLENFEGICKTGRAAAGLNYTYAPIPQARGLQTNIQIGYEHGEGGGGFNSKIETYTETGEDKNRLTAGQVLYTVTSINSSIAFSGGAGAVVSNAIAINPYLLAASIVYGVVTHFMAAEEQAKLTNEIVAANSYMYKNTATQVDVARFYKESCETVLPLIQKIRGAVMDLQTSDQKRIELTTRATESIKERDQYAADADKASISREWLGIYFSASAEKCLNQKKAESLDNASCKLENNRIISLRNSQISLDSDLQKEKTNFDAYKKQIEDHAKAYPIEKRSLYVLDSIVEILAPEWQQVESNFLKFSFETTDSLINSAYDRVNLILSQYRLEKLKSWNSQEDAIFNESRNSEQFEKLKSEYSDLLGQAIKVIFNHGNRVTFQKNAEAFFKEAKPFIKSLFVNKQVMKFSSLVSNFEKIYLKI